MTKRKDEWELEVKVTDVLHEFGVPAHLNGYAYLRKAIMHLVGDMNAAHSITKVLYFDIAKDYDSTINKVERSIRNAIEVAWNRGNDQAFEKYFGYSARTGKNRPCNSEYMVQIADKIRLSMMVQEI
jgi:two-component system response regulator (stage 0 sporulation protein A)